MNINKKIIKKEVEVRYFFFRKNFNDKIPNDNSEIIKEPKTIIIAPNSPIKGDNSSNKKKIRSVNH